MNIFILDLDIKKCAQYHCDQHVVKMTLESAQLLCTSLRKKGFEPPYKSTHAKHPCTLWLEESYDNHLWLQSLMKALNEEYKYRYQKTEDHSSMKVLSAIADMKYERKGLTEFPQAMPETYKCEGDPVKAYRAFYRGEKLKFAKWTRRSKPSWL